MQKDRPAVAVLIDAENVPARLADTVMGLAQTGGRLVIRRIYGDFSHAAALAWKEAVHVHGLACRQHFPIVAGKNGADFLMVIDAMEIAAEGGIDTICLVSSDSDFTPLALRLREKGLSVIGIGSQATPSAFRSACSVFHGIVTKAPNRSDAPKATTTAGTAKPKAGPDDRPADKAEHLILSVLAEIDPDNGGVGLQFLNQAIRKRNPTFTLKAHGAASMAALVKRFGRLHLDKKPKGETTVRLKLG